MKIISLAIIMLVFLSSQVMALAPVNEESITEAQAYGKEKYQLEVSSFLSPWTAFEEQASRLTEFTDRACLYTNFLLIASDARDRTKSNQPVKLNDSEKILADYAGYLVFSVTLHGDEPLFADGTTAVLRQDKKSIKPYQAVVTPVSNGAAVKGRGVYQANCYFYFNEKDLNLSKPVTLAVLVGGKNRLFYFDLTKIK